MVVVVVLISPATVGCKMAGSSTHFSFRLLLIWYLYLDKVIYDIGLNSYISPCSGLCVQAGNYAFIYILSRKKAVDACFSRVSDLRKYRFLLLEGCEQRW